MIQTPNPAPRAPGYLQPQPKASSTSKSSTLSVPASTTPAVSRSSSETRKPHSTANNYAPPVDAKSDRATSAFVRRVLCSTNNATHGSSDARSTPRSIELLLPPLTSSNEVDLQLYAIIAVVIKEFVYAWYAKITPDHHFVDEVVQIIAHCTRALEQRLRRVDLEMLVLDELAGLVEEHIIAFKMAHQSAHSHSDAFGSAPREVYHVLNPHPALSPVPNYSQPESIIEQSENEAIYRQLIVQGALAVLLPTEDLENVCLRTLVGDVVADLILGNGISGKACEGWLIWEGITKLVVAVKEQINPKVTGEKIVVDTRSRLEKYGLLSSKEEDVKYHSPKAHQSHVSALFWRLVQYGYLAFITLRFVALGLARASALPPRASTAPKSNPTSPTTKIGTQGPSSLGWESLPARKAVLEFRSFSLASQLLDLSERMPWLSGLISLIRHWLMYGPGRIGETDGIVDKFLSHLLQTYCLTPAHLPLLLRQTRSALFPNNQPAPPRDPPSPLPAERLAIRRECALQILSLLPDKVARVYFGTKSGRERSSGSANSRNGGGGGGSGSGQGGPSGIVGAGAKPYHGGSGSTSGSGKGRSDDTTATTTTTTTTTTTATTRRIIGREEKENNLLDDHDDVAESHESATTPLSQQSARKGAALNDGISRDDLVSQEIFDEKEFQIRQVEDILDVFGDEYMNKHLIYAILETVIVALVPETRDAGSGELLQERLG